MRSEKPAVGACVLARAVTCAVVCAAGTTAANGSARATSGSEARREQPSGSIESSEPRTDERAALKLVHAARLFAEKKQPVNVLRMWFTHVAFVDAGGDTRHELAMRSALWWNVAHGGLCPDGLPGDEGKRGAGIWPVALHNHLAANLTPRRSEGKDTASPFDAFLLGKQMRRVHRDDVLSTGEIESFRSIQGACGTRRRALEFIAREESDTPYDDAKERVKLARAMQLDLEKALETLNSAHVEGTTTVKARIFDLSLFLNDTFLRKKKLSKREADKARKLNKGAPGETPENAVGEAVVEDSEAVEANADARAFFADVTRWKPSDLALLGANRRLFLYDGALKAAAFDSEEARRAFVLAMLDFAIARKDGADATAWIARLAPHAPGAPTAATAAREAAWKGERGERLVSLTRTEGFTERAPLLLHRGIERLGAGDDRAALRAFALALAAADDSSDAESLRVQARRWVSFALGTYRVDDDVLAVLRDALPREDADAVRDELAWRAALRADAQGYKRLLAGARSRGQARVRLEAVEPLSRGDAGAYLTSFARELDEDATGATRSLDAFLSHVEREDAPVRARLAPLLMRLRRIAAAAMDPADSPSEAKLTKVQGRRAEALGALVRRLDGLLEMLVEKRSESSSIKGAATPDVAESGEKTRTLHPEAAVFAGVVRAPPESDVPWPFLAKDTQPPSVFTPLVITPVDRADANGRVFGWRISE